jgi:ESCRT-I complex subunit VPS28
MSVPPGPPPRYPGAAAGPQQKVVLFTTPTERRKFDDLSELYATIRTTEKLEFAFARDAIHNPEEYTEACRKLIAQFKTTERALQQDGTISDVAAFMRKYNVDCPRAVERLVSVGLPATMVHGLMPTSSSSKANNNGLVSAKVTAQFLTAMDALKLDLKARDQLQPLLQDLFSELSKAEALVPGFDKRTLQTWLETLNGMRASDELDGDQIRQLLFDIERSYEEFMRRLNQDE